MHGRPEPRFQLYGQERFHTGMLASWAIMARGGKDRAVFREFINRLVGESDLFSVEDELEPLIEHKKVDLCLVSTVQEPRGVAIELKVDSDDSKGLTRKYHELLKNTVSHFVYLALGDGEFGKGPHPAFRKVGLEQLMGHVAAAISEVKPSLRDLLGYWYGTMEQELERRKRATDVLIAGEDEQRCGYRNGGARILALYEIEKRVSPRLPHWNCSVYRHGPAPDTILNFRYHSAKPFYAEINRPGRLSLKANNEQMEAAGLSSEKLVELLKSCSEEPELVHPRKGKAVQVARWDLGLWKSLQDMDQLTVRLVTILDEVEQKIATSV